MAKAISVALPVRNASLPAWALLAAELGLAFLLLLSDRLPPVLTRGLQLFLSF
jgi:hypothetical protein